MKDNEVFIGNINFKHFTIIFGNVGYPYLFLPFLDVLIHFEKGFWTL